ncbi:MAG: UDP-N-acetylmuramoyl-tripeptide--D-alanyl-D-alanine ligase [Candidatus Omnitrophota bacterium]
MLKVSEILKATNGKLIRGDADTNACGISTDSRSINKKDAFIAIKGDNFDGNLFINEAIKKGASCIVSSKVRKFVSSQVNYPAIIKVKDTVKALGELARYQRQKFNLPVVAVTGSNGKTTTKDMIARVLSSKLSVLKNSGTKNNHIGLPHALLGLNKSHDIAVLELGTNHPGEIDYLAQIACANIGVITNIGPSHIEFFKDLSGVLREKSSLLNKLQSPRIAIVNADDVSLRKVALNCSRNPIAFSFSLGRKGDFVASCLTQLKDRMEFSVNKKYKFTLKTLGYYNVYNALAAIAVARIFGIGYTDIARKLASFEFPEGRLKARKIRGVNFIDDTYNANPLSLRCSLEVLESLPVKGRKICVMGDMLELGKESGLFHKGAARLVAAVCDVFITVGENCRLAVEAHKHSFKNKAVFSCDNAAIAREILFNLVSPTGDDIILVKGSRAMKMEEVLKI